MAFMLFKTELIGTPEKATVITRNSSTADSAKKFFARKTITIYSIRSSIFVLGSFL
jgi:hypothetical protein